MRGLVIIPAYNEAEAIVQTVHNIQINAPDFDYIVINDCSTDDTKRVLEEHQIRHINLPVNTGIGGAVQTGYIYADRHQYDCAIQMDGDGQHDATFLHEMMTKLENDQADMIIGSRFINNEGFQSTGLRRIGIRYFSWLIRHLTGTTVTDPTSGMRLVNREIIHLFAQSYPKDYPEPESVVVLLKKGYRIREIPVRMHARSSGESSISLKKSIYYMIKVPVACWIAAISTRKAKRRSE